MFALARPSEDRIRNHLDSCASDPFTYPHVGATRAIDAAPRGYAMDHNRVRLGSGEACFARAKQAIESWEMFALDWIDFCWPTTKTEEGATVGVLIRLYGVWTLNVSRVVYTIRDEGDVDRFGFAYGTLHDHAESGEERFLVEHRRSDDSVWYDLLAFSRPHQWFAALGYPLARRLQKRFARDSLRSMVRAAAG